MAAAASGPPNSNDSEDEYDWDISYDPLRLPITESQQHLKQVFYEPNNPVLDFDDFEYDDEISTDKIDWDLPLPRECPRRRYGGIFNPNPPKGIVRKKSIIITNSPTTTVVAENKTKFDRCGDRECIMNRRLKSRSIIFPESNPNPSTIRNDEVSEDEDSSSEYLSCQELVEDTTSPNMENLMKNLNIENTNSTEFETAYEQPMEFGSDLSLSNLKCPGEHKLQKLSEMLGNKNNTAVQPSSSVNIIYKVTSPIDTSQSMNPFSKEDYPFALDKSTSTISLEVLNEFKLTQEHFKELDEILQESDEQFHSFQNLTKNTQTNDRQTSTQDLRENFQIEVGTSVGELNIYSNIGIQTKEWKDDDKETVEENTEKSKDDDIVPLRTSPSYTVCYGRKPTSSQDLLDEIPDDESQKIYAEGIASALDKIEGSIQSLDKLNFGSPKLGLVFEPIIPIVKNQLNDIPKCRPKSTPTQNNTKSKIPRFTPSPSPTNLKAKQLQIQSKIPKLTKRIGGNGPIINGFPRSSTEFHQ